MRIRSRDNDQGEIINISSMIDVMFILIIFFLEDSLSERLIARCASSR